MKRYLYRYADFADRMALRNHNLGKLFVVVLPIGTGWLLAYLASFFLDGILPVLLFVSGFVVAAYVIVRGFRKDTWPMIKDAFFRKSDG